MPLLQLVGYELADLQTMVRDRGLEPTLQALRDAGVYVSFEEFKGRQPIVRHGREFALQPRDFDNPHRSFHYQTESGGSTGAGPPCVARSGTPGRPGAALSADA